MTEQTDASKNLIPAIRVKNLATGYKDHKVFEGINLELRNDEVLCLIGHNGAGKSTLLKTLFGLLPIWEGGIEFHGKSIRPTPSEMADYGVAYVPEGRGVFPNLTVKENFSLAYWSAKIKDEEAQKRENDVLTLLPRIKEFWSRRAGQLSGGQQQMVSIGRAMLSEPKILLLDEPSIGLAPKLFQDLLIPIREYQKTHAMSILLVEQQVGEAFSVADRVVVMKSGEIIFRGVPDDLRDESILMTMF